MKKAIFISILKFIYALSSGLFLVGLLFAGLIYYGHAQALTEFVVLGKVPNTEIFINYESIALGAVFASWLIITYELTIKALRLILFKPYRIRTTYLMYITEES